MLLLKKIKLIMQKVKSNASWTHLSSEQLKTLDKWFFEEKLSYAEILPKAQTELGYKGQMTSLKRYFLRRRKERTIEEFKEVREEVAAISGAPVDPEAVRLASMKVLATFLFQQLRHSPQNIKEIVSVAKLIIQNDYNELLRDTKAEEFDLRRELKEKDHEIRREAMVFAKDKFQYDAIENAVKALPHLQRLAEAMEDPDTTRYRECALEARKVMFGPGEQTPQDEAEAESSEGNEQVPN
jgi:hypothetical protein